MNCRRKDLWWWCREKEVTRPGQWVWRKERESREKKVELMLSVVAEVNGEVRCCGDCDGEVGV